MDAEKCAYKVVLITSSGKHLNIMPLVTSLSWEENNGEIAQRASIEIVNGKYGKKHIKSVIKLCTRIVIKYKQSKKWKEIMRGVVWTFNDDRDSSSKTISLTVYNNLKYLQETEEDFLFGKGATTKGACQKILERCGISCSYNYSSVNRGKVKTFRAKHPSDVLVNVLNHCKRQTDQKYVVYGSKGKCVIDKVGYNTNVYVFEASSILSVTNNITLDGLVTQVEIRSKAEDKKRTRIQAKVDGKTEYGVIKNIIYRDDDTSLKEAKKSAEHILKENGSPQRTITIEAVDVPEIRKGYKIKVNKVEMLNGYYRVVSVTHDADNRQITMEVKKFG